MKALSLKLKDNVYEDVEKILLKMKIPRNMYINQALHFYNGLNQRKLLKKQLSKESAIAGKHSIEILREFERLEEDLP